MRTRRAGIGGRQALLGAILMLCALVAAAFPSSAEARRAALIIANSNYANTKVLPNPINDAQLVADAAVKAGFEIIMATDLSKATFDQALREFRTKADGAEVALIYYAGHGIENGGVNWLIPVDAKLAEVRDLRFEAVDLDALLETLGDAERRIVILDACRDNPFGSNWSIGFRATQRGLVQNPIEGALIVYAASQGQVAVDGTGPNSPFAQAVARRIGQPGLLLQLLGPKVTDDVVAATKGRQRPWTYSGMGGQEFYLLPPPQLAGAAAKPPAGTGSDGGWSEQSYQADSYAWRSADASNTAGDYEDYLGKFPGGVFAQTAKDRLAKLRAAKASGQLASAVTRTTSTGSARTRIATPPAEPATAKTATPAAAAPTDKNRSRGSGRAGRPAPGAASGAFTEAFKGTPSASGSSATPVQPALAKAGTSTLASPAPASSAPTMAGAAMIEASRTAELVPLPVLPATPVFPAAGYPDCRERYQAVADPLGRVNEINQCLQLLNDYSVQVLNAFRAAMADHQKEISRVYTEEVGGQAKYTAGNQQKFFQAMMKEFADSDVTGSHFAEYRDAQARYAADRAYLDDRYCFSTGRCGGYPVPAGIAPPAN